MSRSFRQYSVIPGFGLTMGYTIVYLSLIVLIPLSMLFIKTAGMGWERFWTTVTDPRVVASYKLTFGASLTATLINVVFGGIVAWTLVRYSFPFKKFIDAMVDLPFAIPTAVSGIALTAVYSKNGWIGQFLEPLGIKIAFAYPGVVVAMTFIGLPFVVRTLQPAIEDLHKENEEASASLGASRWQTFRFVILPAIIPSLLTGFAMAFARALGEYGSIVFISGNLPMKTEITTWIITQKLDQYDTEGATAIALVMLLSSFAILFTINAIQWWTSQRHRGVS